MSLREVLGNTPEVSDEELNPDPILNTEEQMKIMKKVNAFVHEQIGGMAHFEHQLKLKLSLNQQLIEKDQEAWEAYA